MNSADITPVLRLLNENDMGTATELRGRLAFLLNLKQGSCLVAEHNGQVVGALIGFFNGFHAYINYFVVGRKYRRRGIGRQLHARFEQFAKRMHARGIITDSRLTATPFYFRLGYALPGAVFLIRRFQ